MSDLKTTLEIETDPAVIERNRAQHERARKNSDWLQAHWGDVLPQARGRFVAVAGQEAFIADTLEAACEWAKTAHPDDNGALVQYVRVEKGPRIYGNYGSVGQRR